VNRKLLGAAAVAVLVATAAAYLPSIDGEFQFDDQEIAKTTWVRDASGFLSPSRWFEIPRPLTGLTFALDHALDGFRPRVWHATNVLVHLAAVMMAWQLARRVLVRAGLSPAAGPAPGAPPQDAGKGKRRAAPPAGAPVPEWPALAAAALFALHPLQTEAVSYISQRSEALASALYMGALVVLLGWDAARPGQRGKLLAAAVALHALGLLAKPIAATMPVAWLLLAVVLPPAAEREVPWLRRVARRLPAAAPMLALSLYAAVGGVTSVRGSGHAGFDLEFVSPLAYVATQLRALPVYLRLMVFPAGLHADWWFPFSKSVLEPAVLARAAFLGALTAGALVLWRRSQRMAGDPGAVARLVAFGWLFVLVVLAPTALVPLRDAFVEHRTYLAVLGIALPLAAAAAALLRRLVPARAGAAGAAVAVAALVALGAATVARNRVWSSALALWTDASEKAPQKARIWVNLGTALHFAGKYEQAIEAYDRALALGFDPTVPVELVVRNTGLALVRLRRYDDARRRLTDYLARAPRDAGTLVILALVEVDTGRLDEAERAARQAAALDARMSRPYQILGQVQELRGDLDGAFAHFRTAAEKDPADALPVYSMGRIYEKRGRIPEACRAYARATDALSRSSAARSARAAYARLCATPPPPAAPP
jgi:tetratricopeptide (TPR) repeat protein